MTDIVERLRCEGNSYRDVCNALGTADVMEEAADEIERLRTALIDATAHLAGAASAYRKHAARHKSQGRAVADAMFSTRVVDFEKATDRARAALGEPKP